MTIDPCDKTVKLVRGDYGEMEVSCSWKEDGKTVEYVLQPSDTLEIGLKRSDEDAEFALYKVVQGSNTIVFEPDDTNAMEPGRYLYSVRLNISGNRPYTLIHKRTFVIGESML